MVQMHSNRFLNIIASRQMEINILQKGLSILPCCHLAEIHSVCVCVCIALGIEDVQAVFRSRNTKALQLLVWIRYYNTISTKYS